MNKLKKMLCVVVAMLAAVTSYAATAADYTDIVYAKDVKASLGGVVEVPIYLKNPSYAVKSLQFTMVLPDGLSFVADGSGHKFSTNALTADWSIAFATKSGEASNTGLATMSYQKDNTTSIASGDVEVFKVYLQVEKNASLGAKTITMKGITLTDGDGGEKTILSGDQTITSSVSIQRAEVIEKLGGEYALEILPFSVAEGASNIELKLKSPSKLKDIQFDIELPQGMMLYDSEFNKSEPELVSGVTTTKSPSVSLIVDADHETYMDKATVTFTGTNTGAAAIRKYFNAQNTLTTIAKIPVYVVPAAEISDWGEDYKLAQGVHTIKLSNIVLKDYETGNVAASGEYLCSVTVGTPTDKDPIIYGNITDASTVIAAIPADATSVDISQATASDAVVDAIVTDAQEKNKNAIVYAPSTYSGTMDNVVTEDENGSLTCTNFVATDGEELDIPASFTATNASYSRTFAGTQTWGTICLPYEVASSTTEEYYAITALTEGVLTISKYETLPAGTPALVRKLSGDGIAPTATNVVVGGDAAPISGTVTMHGTFKKIAVFDSNAYYLKDDNKFYHINQYFNCDTFRAYFTVSTSPGKPGVITIGEDETTAINALVGESDVKVEAIYDASGARQSEIKNGLNIVKLSNGKTQKIMVK